MDIALDIGKLLLALVLLWVVVWFFRRTFVYINSESYGVVEKLWSFSKQRRKGFVALEGEPGFQPDLITTGWHWFFPLMYKIHKQPMITVKGIAYLFARDGLPLLEGQTLAKLPSGVDILDARGFLMGGGQKGPQRHILRQGYHAINTALFAVFTEEGIFTVSIGDDGDKEDVLETLNATLEQTDAFNPVVIEQDAIGVVTVNDGPSLEHGEIVAPAVGTDKENQETFHNSFQSIEKFLVAGGKRGRQEQVLVEGTYYINRLFATVESKDKLVIDIGNVGVVNSYTGVTNGKDVSGDEFKHGTLVEINQRGIWREPLLPGKYAINPYAMSVTRVPTTNLVLRWAAGHNEAHGFDTNLKEIDLITSDAFEPIVGLSIVVHIDPKDAPYVIQQFSDIQKLVDQTLDTIVASWFKDAAQKTKLLELIQQRAELQVQAKKALSDKFAQYKIAIQEIMLGTPRSTPGDDTIETVYNQLRKRQLAREEMETFAVRQEAAASQAKFNDEQANADNAASLRKSKIEIEIAENVGAAELARKRNEAAAMVEVAKADAERVRLIGEAEAGKIQSVGAAEAAAAKAQVDAYGNNGAQMALTKALTEILANAVQNSDQPIVPQVVMGEGGANSGGLPALLSALFLNNGGMSKLIAPPMAVAAE